jgi:hypothetical protein
VKLLTGNDLVTGDVIWWNGNGWSRHVADAVDVADKGDGIATTEAAARRVNGAYVIDAAPGPTGPVPLHIKERIRATGPTVRPDLAIQPADKSAGSYVI